MKAGPLLFAADALLWSGALAAPPQPPRSCAAPVPPRAAAPAHATIFCASLFCFALICQGRGERCDGAGAAHCVAPRLLRESLTLKLVSVFVAACSFILRCHGAALEMGLLLRVVDNANRATSSTLDLLCDSLVLAGTGFTREGFSAREVERFVLLALLLQFAEHVRPASHFDWLLKVGCKLLVAGTLAFAYWRHALVLQSRLAWARCSAEFADSARYLAAAQRRARTTGALILAKVFAKALCELPLATSDAALAARLLELFSTCYVFEKICDNASALAAHAPLLKAMPTQRAHAAPLAAQRAPRGLAPPRRGAAQLLLVDVANHGGVFVATPRPRRAARLRARLRAWLWPPPQDSWPETGSRDLALSWA